MVRGDFVTLAALLVEAKPPALPLRVEVLDAHVGDGADAAEGVDHDGDERAIAQADEGLRLDRLEEAARLGAAQDRRLAALRGVLGPADGGGRVHAEDAVHDEVVAEHADRREVLLHRRRGAGVLFDVGGDDHRLELREADAALFAPGAELRDGGRVRAAGVLVADLDGEEVDGLARGLLAGVGEERGDDDPLVEPDEGRLRRRRRSWCRLPHCLVRIGAAPSRRSDRSRW